MVSESEIKEVKLKAKAFLKENSFVFIKAIKENGSHEYLNGYVVDILPDYIRFQDIETKEIIPVFFSEITKEDSIFELSRKPRPKEVKND